MLHALLIIAVAGTPPRAPADAQVVGVLPVLSQASQLLPFFEKAGTRSVLARPEAWKTDAHALIEVDVTKVDAVKAVGIDVTAPLTRAQVGDASVSCVRLINVDAYRRACDARLARTGDAFEKIEGGVSIYGARDPIGRVLVAYTILGKDSCAANGHGRSVESLFPSLAKATLKPASGAVWTTLAPKVPGVLQLVGASGTTTGVAALNVKDVELTVDARLKNAPFAQFAGAGQSVLGQFRAPGMAVIRGRVLKAQVPTLIDQVVRAIPGGPGVLPIARLIAPYVTGNTAMLLSHVKVTSGLRTKEARFFALKGVLLAELSDPIAVKTIVDELDPSLLRVREGALSVSVEGGVLVVSNDADAKVKALAALATANGKQSHGVEFEIDPRGVAKGLQQVPLLEAVQAPELAVLVAASTELGPLLLATAKINGWVDSAADAQHVTKLVWLLDAAKFETPDAGVAP